MTQKYPAGFAPLSYDSTGESLQTDTVPTFRDVAAKMTDRRRAVPLRDIQTSSSDAVLRFRAEGAGKIVGLVYTNGSVAADGSNGLELDFINLSNSNDRVAYFGVGSGTEAAKATDKITAVAADAVGSVACTDTSRFNANDVIQCTVDRDGTTIVGIIEVIVDYDGLGR